MARPYAALRGELMKNDIDQAYLCELLGRSQTYLTQRFTGRRSWEQDEMYFLLDLLLIPHDQLHLYFPKGGVLNG